MLVSGKLGFAVQEVAKKGRNQNSIFPSRGKDEGITQPAKPGNVRTLVTCVAIRCQWRCRCPWDHQIVQMFFQVCAIVFWCLLKLIELQEFSVVMNGCSKPTSQWPRLRSGLQKPPSKPHVQVWLHTCWLNLLISLALFLLPKSQHTPAKVVELEAQPESS